MLYIMSSHESDTKTRILEATWKLMEESRGQGARMSDIAKAAGISRQAVYLHFESRTDLMIATTSYVDEIKGLEGRLKAFEKASSGVEVLETLVEVWGKYIPEIYGLAKALLSTRETDEAAAAAWNSSMGCLRDACRDVVEALEADGELAPEWAAKDAIEMLLTLISIYNWEQLTVESGWSTDQYIKHMKMLLKRALVKSGRA